MKRLLTGMLLVVASTSHALIDMKNANFSDTWTFLEVPGSGYDLRVITTYNSKSLFNGMFGYGWCSEFETSLEVLPEGNIKLSECGDGLEVMFAPKAGNTNQEITKIVGQIMKEVKAKKPLTDKQAKEVEALLTRSPELRADYAKNFNIVREVKDGTQFFANGRGVESITRKSDGFVRAMVDGTSQKFDLQGHLSQLFDKNGNHIKFTYKGELLTDIVDNNGRKLTITYHTNSKKVKEIVGPNKMVAEFQFKNVSDLSEVKAANGILIKMDYDDLHNLTKVAFPDNTTKELTYDTNRDWVTGFKDRDGCHEKYDYVLSKDDPKNHYWSTVEKKCEGKVTNQSRFEFWYKTRKDGLGKYLERVAMDVNGDKTDITYHEIFAKPTVMKKNGKATTFTYLDNGLVKTREFNKEVTTFAYESKFSKVSQVKVGKRTTDFEYDSRGNLTLAKNSGGQIVKLQYDQTGRIAQIEDQAKRKVKISYEERFGKPKFVERIGVGSISVTYKPTGEINKIESDAGPSVAVQVASTFNNLLDVISPAGIDLGL